MFERPDVGQRAVLVHMRMPFTHWDADQQEFTSLVEAAGGEVLQVLSGSRQQPDPRFFIGSGKAEELAELVRAEEAELVVVNHPISPAQERNLEAACKCRVIGRTGLILDIFAQRARSHEGQLQVELAQLRYLSTRLVRGWSHLERQRGGIGLRGPGETQLETDRRLLAVRVKSLQRQLEEIATRRELGRHSRRRNNVVTVSLVGYTNAGKSSLFNVLTGAGVLAMDQVFATLDATLRKIDLPHGAPVVLVDTVGFIRDLPHELVAAFRSTLEETKQADLILHVVDASDPERLDRINDVQQVLDEIGADEVPMLTVMTKIDLSGDQPDVMEDEAGLPRRAWVSAYSGQGIEALRDAIARKCYVDEVTLELQIPAADGALRATLYRHAEVIEEQADEQAQLNIKVRGSQQRLELLCKQSGYELMQLVVG